MDEKELVRRFFIEGYQNKNYDFIMECVAKDYIDHSLAYARSNQDAVNILKAVEQMFSDLQIRVEGLFGQNGMIAARIRFDGIHAGECMRIAPTGKPVSFEALESFESRIGRLSNRGDTGRIVKLSSC